MTDEANQREAHVRDLWFTTETTPAGKAMREPTMRESTALNRNHINEYIWKPTLERLGIIPRPGGPNGHRTDLLVI